MYVVLVLLVLAPVLSTKAGARVQPNGYLVAIKTVLDDDPYYPAYNHASLFKIELNGTVSENWNYSFQPPHIPFDENSGYAIDAANDLVYVCIGGQFLALSLSTGTVRFRKDLKPPNLQLFTTYDYNPQDGYIYGICTGDWAWNWCRVSFNTTKNGDNVDFVKVDFLYLLPGVTELGPAMDLYTIDLKHQIIWYYPYSQAFAMNFTTGKVFYTSGVSESDQYLQGPLCIVYDYELNRTFTIERNKTVGELQPNPKPDKILLDLPLNITLSEIGACTYDVETHTMFALMRNDVWPPPDENSMPSELLIIDVIKLNYERVSLKDFHKKWSSGDLVGFFMYIPN